MCIYLLRKNGDKMEEFDVIFLDDDKKTVLANYKVEYGESVKYAGKTPTKEPINGIKYNFVGWVGEEKLVSIVENTVVYAKYEEETNMVSNEVALLQASLNNAEQMNYNVIVEASKKAISQEQAIAKDPRTAEQIVSDIIKNGKTEVGQNIDRDFEK